MAAAALTAAALEISSLSSGPGAQAAGLSDTDFIKTNRNVLKTNNGNGSTINLRGTNIGGSGIWSWSTGSNQSGGEWVKLDLASATLFNRLTLDNLANQGNYARAVKVEISADGSSWNTVAAQPGTDGVTTVKFTPQVARYLRVTQTGAGAAPWSLAEINLYSDTVKFNGSNSATASSSAGGTSPSMVLDGNVSTVWQSGAAQSPGQSLTIDLGRRPRGYCLETAADGSNWTSASTGIAYGWKRPASIEPTTARYLRITQTGTASPRRSIDDVTVYSSY